MRYKLHIARHPPARAETVVQRHWCANVSFQLAGRKPDDPNPYSEDRASGNGHGHGPLPHPPSIPVSSCCRIISLASKFHFHIWSSKVRPLVPVTVRHMKLRAVAGKLPSSRSAGAHIGLLIRRPAEPSADRSSRGPLRRSSRLPVAVSSMDRSLIFGRGQKKRRLPVTGDAADGRSQRRSEPYKSRTAVSSWFPAG